jgi:heat shock protein HslJ
MILTLALAAAAACGSGGTNPQQGTTEEAITVPSPGIETEVGAVGTLVELFGTWTLVAVDGAPITAVGKKPTLEVSEDGSVTGVGGVNRFNTNVELVDGRLSFGPVAATKMAGPPEAMDLENTYLARLGAVSSYEVGDDTLRLWAGDNEALTFVRAEIEP